MGTFRTSATTPTSCFLLHRSSARPSNLLPPATSACRGSPRGAWLLLLWPMPASPIKGPDMLAERPPAPCKAPTGIQGLDEIADGGLPAGRPTLSCGTAGCGKTMLAMEFL